MLQSLNFRASISQLESTLTMLFFVLQEVVDSQGSAWAFLCTCYGCQYALSRVGKFLHAADEQTVRQGSWR
jgi:hypothetical protein